MQAAGWQRLIRLPIRSQTVTVELRYLEGIAREVQSRLFVVKLCKTYIGFTAPGERISYPHTSYYLDWKKVN